MNMFARFDENPAMTLQVIKETKRYGRTDGRTDGRTHGQRENSIPPTNKVCGGYNYIMTSLVIMNLSLVSFKGIFIRVFKKSGTVRKNCQQFWIKIPLSILVLFLEIETFNHINKPKRLFLITWISIQIYL